jgi:hypothetical protein
MRAEIDAAPSNPCDYATPRLDGYRNCAVQSDSHTVNQFVVALVSGKRAYAVVTNVTASAL